MSRRRRRRRRRENSFRRWILDVAILINENKIIAASIFGFIVLVIVALVISSAISKKKATQEEAPVVTEAVQEQVLVSEEPLEVDAYEGVNNLMRKYYDAVAIGDVATVKEIKTSVDEKEEIIIQTKSNYVESYPVVTCYTKKGPDENTFIVFAYYEVKLVGYENMAPGLNAWYVCQREDGTYYINDDEQDETLSEYCKIVSVQDDVVDLNNTVNVKFNEVVEADTELASFLELLPDILTASVGEELAKADEPEQTVETTDDGNAEGTEAATDTQVEKTGKTTDVVKIRVSDSMTADTVGKAQKGQQFKILEQKINGWTKIEYDGKECFIKSEYIAVDGEEAPSTATDEVTNEAAAANSPTSGKAKATDTLNIRESASTTSDKIATCYQGEEVTVLEKQSNGWSKIKYGNKTGYVKSEYLE